MLNLGRSIGGTIRAAVGNTIAISQADSILLDIDERPGVRHSGQGSLAPLLQINDRVVLKVDLAHMALPAGQVPPVNSRTMVVLATAIPDEEPSALLQQQAMHFSTAASAKPTNIRSSQKTK